MNGKHIYIIKAIKSIYFSNYYCAIYEHTYHTHSFENRIVFIDGVVVINSKITFYCFIGKPNFFIYC